MCCLPDALAVKVSSVPSQTPASPDGIIHHHARPETDLGKSKCYLLVALEVFHFLVRLSFHKTPLLIISYFSTVDFLVRL